MPEFKFVDVQETPYLFVTRSCSMDPADISQAMGEVFQKVWGFMQANGIAPAGGALAVYHTYHPETMTFRAGFVIGRDDMAKAADGVEADVTPAGEVLHFVHKGPYRTLRDSYGQMMAHVADIGREVAAPTWEIYVNDPNQVAEDDLLTEVYSVLK